MSQTALDLRYVFCDRTVPVGKVFSSSSRCDEASFAVHSSARIENESAAICLLLLLESDVKKIRNTSYVRPSLIVLSVV